MKAILLVLLPLVLCQVPSKLAPTPPMGWMSWEVFRCETDCSDYPNSCINEDLYKSMADAMADNGYLAAGYHTVSIDDCWEQHSGRVNGKLVPDSSRFPNGMKALGDYMHSKGVNFGIYTDEGTNTCGGYPGSEGYEEVDAKTFAEWGVDYLKVDGCYNNEQGYETGYPAFGKALQNSGRDIVYSCSWPAYQGENENDKSFPQFIDAGCNLWRNWDDIQGSYDSMASIIDHWGQYDQVLQHYGGKHHWNDMDMLLIGNDYLSVDEAQTQLAMWSMNAAPLIMGNDLRSVSQEFKDVLLAKEVIAVDQDSLGIPGLRLVDGNQQVWARNLSDGSYAVALHAPNSATEITLDFSILGHASSDEVSVRDLYAGKDLGTFKGHYTASVNEHGVKMLKVSA